MSNLPLYRKIFRLTFVHSGIRAVFSVCTALSMIFIIRVMGPNEFGRFTLVLQLALTFGLFLSWGSAGTLAKFVPEYPEESKKTLSSQAMEISLISLAMFIIGFFCVYWIHPAILPLEIKSLKFPFILYITLFALFNVLQGVFRGLGRFIQWSLIEGSNDLVCRFAALGLFLYFGIRYDIAFYGYVATLFAFTFFAFFQTRNQYHPTHLIIDEPVRKFGLIMLLGSFVFMLGTSLDVVFLRSLLKDPAEVGFYSAGIRIPQIFQGLLLSPLSIPFTYYFTHPETLHTREQIIKLGTKLLACVCAIVSLSLFSFGSAIVPLLYGKFYGQSIQVLRIYSFVFFLIGMQSLLPPFFVAINKLHITLISSFICTFVLGLLDLWLIPSWKSSGSALANVLVLVFQNMAYLYIVSKHNIDIIKQNLILILLVLISVAVEHFLIPFSSVTIFILLIVVTRYFSREEVEKIQRVISKSESPAA